MPQDDELVMCNYLLAQQCGQWHWFHTYLIHSKPVEALAFQQVGATGGAHGRWHLLRVRHGPGEGLDAIAEACSHELPANGEVLTPALSFTCDRYQEAEGCASEFCERDSVRLPGSRPTDLNAPPGMLRWRALQAVGDLASRGPQRPGRHGYGG
jgi:hypothetical protein